jgi:hypothetical protein
VVENPPERRGYRVIERPCRIVFDVNVRVTEITPESVADYFTPGGAGEGISWEWAERQNRFLLALLRNEGVLDQFLTGIAKGDFGFLLESDRIRGMSDEEEGALFEKVFAGMGADDRDFFRRAKKDGVLHHNMELVHTAVVTDWGSAEIKDVRVLKRAGE